jgi:toxin ParE1/3/4
MPKPLEVEFTPAASRDLLGIHLWSIETFGREVAAAYLADLESATQQLARFPNSGPLLRGTTRRVRALACRSHRLIYMTSRTRILVIRILHEAMDMARHVPPRR